MSRDYAKRNFTRKKAKKSRTRWHWRLIILLLAGGALLVGVKLFNKYKHYRLQLIPAKVATQEGGEQPLPTAAITKTITTPQFDFYNILASQKTPKTAIAYELAIATVDTFAAADQLKAELALLGVAASIISKHHRGHQKYYVSTGPYANKTEALLEQQRLKANKIKSSLKKIH